MLKKLLMLFMLVGGYVPMLFANPGGEIARYAGSAVAPYIGSTLGGVVAPALGKAADAVAGSIFGGTGKTGVPNADIAIENVQQSVLTVLRDQAAKNSEFGQQVKYYADLADKGQLDDEGVAFLRDVYETNAVSGTVVYDSKGRPEKVYTLKCMKNFPVSTGGGVGFINLVEPVPYVLSSDVVKGGRVRDSIVPLIKQKMKELAKIMGVPKIVYNLDEVDLVLLNAGLTAVLKNPSEHKELLNFLTVCNATSCMIDFTAGGGRPMGLPVMFYGDKTGTYAALMKSFGVANVMAASKPGCKGEVACSEVLLMDGLKSTAAQNGPDALEAHAKVEANGCIFEK